ncbi:ATP-dependent DNA ligase, partial [Peniophora sp. CONT]
MASQVSPGLARTGSLHPEVIDLVDSDEEDDVLPDTSTRSAASSKPVATPSDTGATITAQPLHNPIEYPVLSVDPALLNIDVCPWRPDTPAPYAFLAHALSTLSNTKSRIAIINTLTNTLRHMIRHHPPSVLPALYLLSNALSPPYMSVELGLGPSIISKAIQDVSGLTSAALKKLYNATGDAGDVAFEAKAKVRTLIPHPPLLVTSLYTSLLKIANAKGSGAAKAKQQIVEKLLVAAKGEEARFLVRTLAQHIRVGAVRTSLLTALARAAVLTPPADNSDSDASDYYFKPSKIPATAPAGSAKKAPSAEREELLDIFGRAEALMRRTFVQHPNYDHIVAALLQGGLNGLHRVSLTVGIPLHPTLGSPMRSLEDVYDRVQDIPFVAEFKYDGQRAQIHASSDENGGVTIKIFSRHLEDMTDKYPDVVALFQHIIHQDEKLNSFIIDAEIVAIDPKDGSTRSFQDLSNRARKAVQLHEVQVFVAVYVFDLMYLNGEVLLQQPFRQRRTALHVQFSPMTVDTSGVAQLRHVESCESRDGKEVVEEFWMHAVEGRCEGLMIKVLDNGLVNESSDDKKEKGRQRKKPLPATYEPDKRTSAWLKLKKDYVMTLGDTLDLVPVGGWHGNGRKAQWWSPVLLALRDPDTGFFVAVCKCMSGFSDTFYKEMKARYSEDSDNCSPRPLWGDVDTGGYRPAVYFRPHEVWELRGADITLSPVSVAARGLVSTDRGLSLRFPRFIRTREDKPLEGASTPDFLASMWRKQEARGPQQKAADDGDLVDAAWSEDGVSEGEESEPEAIQ